MNKKIFMIGGIFGAIIFFIFEVLLIFNSELNRLFYNNEILEKIINIIMYPIDSFVPSLLGHDDGNLGYYFIICIIYFLILGFFIGCLIGLLIQIIKKIN